MTASYQFPSYESLPPGAVYSGAPSNYGQTHISSIISTDPSGIPASSNDPTSESSPPGDRGLTVFSPDTFSKGGLLRVAKDRITKGAVADPSVDAAAKGARPPDRSQPGFQIWYEVHGDGPVKVIFIMGLNNSAFGWLGQVEHFAKDPRYSLLVFDNRGYGNSETPREMKSYSTSEMAKDVVEICEHLQWTEQKQLNVVGVSMGGMIALELAKAIPERISSLALLSTTSGRAGFTGEKSFKASLPPWAGVATITRLMAGKMLGIDSAEYPIKRLVETLFPPKWLEEESKVVPGKKNGEVTFDFFLWRFHFTRRQSPAGSFGQVRAATSHRVPNATLQLIASSISSVLIVTGDWDQLVNPGNSYHLRDNMPGATFRVFEGCGHAIQAQDSEGLNKELEECFKKGEGWK